MLTLWEEGVCLCGVMCHLLEKVNEFKDEVLSRIGNSNDSLINDSLLVVVEYLVSYKYFK